MDKLTPLLTETQLKQNIDALQKGGTSNDKIQSFVDNYKKDPTSGNYVLSKSVDQLGSLKPIPLKEDISKVAGQVASEQKSSDTGQISPITAGIKMAGDIGGGISDVFGQIATSLGLDKLIGSFPTFDPSTNKMTTWGEALPQAFADIKVAGSKIQSIKDISSSVESFVAKHPQAKDDVVGLLKAFGGALSLSGVGDIGKTVAGGVEKLGAGAVEKTAVQDLTTTAEESAAKVAKDSVSPASEVYTAQPISKGTSNVIKKALADVPKPIQNAMSGLVTKLGNKAMPLVQGILGAGKTLGLEGTGEGAVGGFADTQLSDAKDIIQKSLETSQAEKVSSLQSFGDSKVSNLNEPYKKFQNDIQSLTGVSLSSADSKLWTRFEDELMGLTKVGNRIAKNDVTSVDKFVDNYGWAKAQDDRLQGIIRSATHDVNEQLKTTMDGLDNGAYRKANEIYSTYKQASDDLEKGMGTKLKGTGRFEKAGSFFAEAAKNPSSPNARILANIEQLTGVPLKDSATLSTWADGAFKDVPSLKEVTKKFATLSLGMFGKRSALYSVMDYLQDPAGEALSILDKQTNGGYSKYINEASSLLEQSKPTIDTLKKVGLDSKQGATMLLVGQLLNSKGLKGANNSQDNTTQ